MKSSFSLIEVLVVATIIGVLLTGASVSYTSLTKSSRDAKRKSELEQVRAALEMYRSNDTSSLYPVGVWADLSTALTGYIGTLPTDPKDPTYTYGYDSTDGTSYTLGAHLESTTTTCTSLASCAGGCNYCLGPYGQKQ
ncbi:type II secretion system protein [Candidatus Roizmanbacteria bacterium]|nr:type II secretion system protein [Candidatus Roizmanbacteria bacterium]